MSFNEKLSYTEHVVTSPATDFSIGFKDYGKDSDTIKVTVNDILATDAGYTVFRKNAMTIALEPAITSGVVRLQRETNIDRLFYRFTAGAKFVAANIDANFNQILHSQQETRDGFNKLAGDVYPLVNGLEVALEKADSASKAAQEAAEAAEAAAQVTRSASQVIDSSGINQQVINSAGKSVNLVSDLIKLDADDGDVVTVNGYTKVGLGRGTYKFEAYSSKVDNGGAWLRSTKSTGVWVLISPLYFENFGVINNGLDQSSRIQACIDFADNQGILSYGFEKPNTYCVSKSIVFKPILNSRISTFFSTEQLLTVKLNGAKLKPLAPIVVIKIHREHVYFDSIQVVSDTLINATALRIGLHDDPEYPIEYRRSSTGVHVTELSATNIKIGVQFCPSKSDSNGFTWGGYYHNFGNIVFRNVTYGLLLDLALDGKNQTTRSTVNSYSHNGGACAFVGLNVETFTIKSFFAENLNSTSDDYPDANNRAVYILNRGTGMIFPNHTVVIKGSCEEVKFPILCEADNCEIDIVPVHFSVGDAKAMLGYFNSGYGGAGVMSVSENLNTFVFPYQTSRNAAVGIKPNTVGVSSLPAGMSECYGNIQYLVTSSHMSSEGVQVLTTRYPLVGKYMRTVTGVPATFSNWIRVDKSVTVARHSSVENVNANTLKVSGERVTYGVTFSSDKGSNLNSPSGGEFYGAIEWIPTISDQGVQIAYGNYPDIVRKRNFSGVWSPWKVFS